MNTIHFHDDFFSLIKEGKKTQTIRYKEDINNIGKSMAIFDNHEGIDINILSLTDKTFEQLNIDEVRKDGFESKDELWNVLLRFYPKLMKNENLCLIEFQRID